MTDCVLAWKYNTITCSYFIFVDIFVSESEKLLKEAIDNGNLI